MEVVREVKDLLPDYAEPVILVGEQINTQETASDREVWLMFIYEGPISQRVR